LFSAIEQGIAGASVKVSFLKGTGKRYKLVVWQKEVSVKIEVAPVLRGSVYPAEFGELSARARAAFGFARVKLLSFEDLYAGKLCAALDRQHPRDLYDVQLLLDNEGINERMKNAFLVCLMSHNRPMAELLEPIPQEIGSLYRAEFEGMTYEPVSLERLGRRF
jgi:predicted nucleotidyltransferase component of viral defense system